MSPPGSTSNSKLPSPGIKKVPTTCPSTRSCNRRGRVDVNDEKSFFHVSSCRLGAIFFGFVVPAALSRCHRFLPKSLLSRLSRAFATRDFVHPELPLCHRCRASRAEGTLPQVMTPNGLLMLPHPNALHDSVLEEALGSPDACRARRAVERHDRTRGRRDSGDDAISLWRSASR
jgi:hypothetical protein